ncbi:MAG TPA: methyl-accepting chemotaxis protein [Methylophaga sp.]|jgi:methyl-accepting chemotaxis protein|nr:chemotaxis protein [Methylophaga sp.]MBL1456632.1 methyl-accepting chemotaxis protein [Methylophaga sp.]HAD31479.1 methyl-accepting chemotaxis protein [Methylophaga sp.]HBX59077.1 methyl-accepting chemotaxis protein [Methylophaga sp.]|tara:strand:+ start:4074 stop:5231 length:1158 start_codon:yes stop_codon:yes gene_type:complete
MYIVAGFGIIGLVVLAGLMFYMELNAVTSMQQLKVVGGFVVIGSALIMFMAHVIGRFGDKRATTLVNGIQNIKKGDLTQKIAISGKSDFSWMAFELDSARKNVANLVHTLIGGVSQLNTATQNMTVISKETVTGVLKQQEETDQVATAMNEMTASVQEVARTATNAAEAARNADNEAKAGKQVVLETMQSIDTLASEVEKAAETLSELEADIGNIGAIVDVIRGITEQTNLLALNAAIEAARAGEHGRGFAVVADEVRTLAARTQSSTHEIEEMVERLQQGARAAVKVMNESRESAKTSVEKAASAGSALDTITAMISTMDEMSTQISNAANEQSSVAEDINRGIVNISQIADHTADGARATSEAVDTLSSLSSQLQDASGKFKV